MIWQDIVIMIGVFGFSFALIPSILGKHKPAKSSCALSAALATMILICFASLGLWLSVVAEMVSVTTWLILLIQKRHEHISVLGSK